MNPNPASDQTASSTRLEFELLVSGLSARFFNLPAGEVDRGIEDALGKVRTFFDVDRCALVRFFPETGEIHPTHFSQKEHIPGFPAAGDFARLFPWTADCLLGKGMDVNLRTRDFPPEAPVDRASAEALGMKGILVIPLLSGGAVRYMVGIDTEREEKEFPGEYIPRLRLLGEIFVNALERRHADETLRKTIDFERLVSGLSARSSTFSPRRSTSRSRSPWTRCGRSSARTAAACTRFPQTSGRRS